MALAVTIINFKNTTRKMKKIVLMLIVALMGTMVTNAQPPRRHNMDPQQMVEKRVERLDKALGLTAEQKAEITKIYTLEMEAMSKDMPARDNKSEKPDEAVMKAHHEKMKAEREATNAKVASLLTPEQAAKFAEMKDHKGKRGHGKRHDRWSEGEHGHKKANQQRNDCCKRNSAEKTEK